PKQGLSTQCARLISARTGIPNSNSRAGKKDEDDTAEDDWGLRSASRLREGACCPCAESHGARHLITLPSSLRTPHRALCSTLYSRPGLIPTFFRFYFYPSAHNINTNTRTPGRRAHTPTGYRPRGVIPNSRISFMDDKIQNYVRIFDINIARRILWRGGGVPGPGPV
ncbi:hypothetical protein FIBSPDRAFT_871815, partial [Athelia psychrophila]